MHRTKLKGLMAMKEAPMDKPLAEYSCIPCKGGTPSLTSDQIAPLLIRLDHGWKVEDDAGVPKLVKRYKLRDFVQAVELRGELLVLRLVGALGARRNACFASVETIVRAHASSSFWPVGRHTKNITAAWRLSWPGCFVGPMLFESSPTRIYVIDNPAGYCDGNYTGGAISFWMVPIP
jgi:hypothetical protein